MADEALVKLLRDEGREAWNAWRMQNLGSPVDLSGADLTRAYLSGADLSGVHLEQADLSGAQLEDARLANAILRDAKLTLANLLSADLEAAILTGANLMFAHLIGTNLQNAQLNRSILNLATLSATNLKGADFTDCSMGATILADTDLSEAANLEKVRHLAPSALSIDTIYRSKGNIHQTFLRGAGVPEDFIAYIKSLVGRPFEFYSCFVSYSSKDTEFCQYLYESLQAAAVRCWFAPENLKIGDPFHDRIEESIRIYDKLLVVLSERSIQSRWVETEVKAALEKEARSGKLALFPIRLDDAVMETEQAWASSLRRTRHIGDFRDWKDPGKYKKASERLLRDLKAEGTVNLGPP